jgi:hypothetical protein
MVIFLSHSLLGIILMLAINNDFIPTIKSLERKNVGIPTQKSL